MKLWPVSNPMTSSNSQNARLAASSAISFLTSSRKRKKTPLDPPPPRRQLVQRPLSYRYPVIEQQKAIAGPSRIAQLVNGEHQQATLRGIAAKNLHHLPGL